MVDICQKYQKFQRRQISLERIALDSNEKSPHNSLPVGKTLKIRKNEKNIKTLDKFFR